ncbi:hypothetical protein [Paraflavitalea speifideaquila]|uniref:hypothetical protein n=1 Tax=Paraflavitalea speifideaquila TaxID=3076558 RepID=UPI0028EB09F5|nr:hypothetical protein [Paraflavitalea speifideiaquila]
MNEETVPIPGAENPDIFTGLKLGSVKTSAAGMPAVLNSFKQVFGEAGVLRGLKALSHLNQKVALTVPVAPGPIRTMSAAALPNIAKMAPRP